jgi:hypothetical protein
MGAPLFVDDELVGEADFDVTVPLALGIGGGASVGRNPGSTITVKYAPPYPFSGTIHAVKVNLAEPEHDDPEEAKKAEARVAMARQ